VTKVRAWVGLDVHAAKTVACCVDAGTVWSDLGKTGRSR